MNLICVCSIFLPFGIIFLSIDVDLKISLAHHSFKPTLASRNSPQLLSINPFIKTYQDLKVQNSFKSFSLQKVCAESGEKCLLSESSK